MPKCIRVNVRSLANTKAVRRERRNGRDKIIVPSATLPDDVVMNGIMYPADEIEGDFEKGTGYRTLNGKLAPFGHPTIEGAFVSASHPDGLAAAWIGAHNENVRREVGSDGRSRVLLDKVIDVARAKESDGGKAVLDAIEKGEPIHTSTGLIGNVEDAPEGSPYKMIMRNMVFDHDAILIGEEGAATPDDGVGIFVNSKGEEEQIEVVNSVLEDAERELDWAVDMAARAVERMERIPLLDRIKSAIKEAVTGSEREPSANKGEADMAVTDEQFSALSAKVNAIEESLKPEKLGEVIGNAVTEAIKPVKEHVDQIEANQKAATEAKRTEAINTLTKGGEWTEEELKDMTLPALNKLVEKSKPGKAAALNGAYNGGGGDAPAFKLPKGEEAA